MANPRGNTYLKQSGVKVNASRSQHKQQGYSRWRNAMGKAQDTGRGRGPLRGVARRARENANLEDVKRYPSQDVAKSSARGRARTEGKITDGKLTPTPETPVKRSTRGSTRIGPLARGGAGMGGLMGNRIR